MPTRPSFEVDFHKALHAIKKHKQWIIGISVASLLLTILITWQQKSVYQSQAKLIYGSNLSASILSEGSSSLLAALDRLNTQTDVIQSTEVLKRANASLPQKQDINLIRKNLTVYQRPSSNLFVLRYRHSNPQQAAQTLNAITESYQQFTIEQRLSTAKRSLNWLTEQLVDVRKRLQEAEKDLLNYQQQQSIFLVKGTDIHESQSVALNEAYTRLRTENLILKVEAERLDKLLKQKTDLVHIPFGDSEDIRILHSRLTQARLSVAGLRSRYLDKHPKVQEAMQQVKLIETEIANSLHAHLKRLNTQLAEGQNKEGQIKKNLSKHNQEMLVHYRKQIEFDLMKKETDAQKSLFNALNQKLKELDILSALQESSIEIIESAQVPVRPISPNKPRNIQLGLLLGLLAVCMLALILELTDRSIQSAEDLKQVTDIPLLASLPQLEEIQPESIPYMFEPQHAHSSLAEQFRSLRTNLDLLKSDHPHPILAITSSHPQEGKTTIASNLAIALAQAGRKTLLIDADLRRPSIAPMFHLHSNSGLFEVLQQNKSLAEVIINSGLNGLDIIPAGQVELTVAGDAIEQSLQHDMLEHIRTDYEHIIIDAPPLILHDATLLAAYATATMLIIGSGMVQRRQLLANLEQLARTGTPIIGCVLNMLQPDHMPTGSYHNYYQYRPYMTGHEDNISA